MRFPIGAFTFRDVIDSGDSYIDKSLFVNEVFQDSARAILLLRPRRFGKTLNLSMLHHFLADQVHGQETRDLFSGLNISKMPVMNEQGQYPVIFITFKDMKKDTFIGAIERYRTLMASLYDNYYYLLDSSSMMRHHKEKFLSILKKTSSEEDLELALYDLSSYLYRHHNKKVWVLMDEYDAPLLSSYDYHYYDQMCGFMRGCLSQLLKDNSYLHKAVITGILRISKESLFSGVNNLDVYSMLDDKYAEHFGFTQFEVDDILQRCDLSDKASEVKTWYNGYYINNITLYNPWSISKFAKSAGKFDLYWVNTAEDVLIRKMIINSANDFKEHLETLLAGSSITTSINLNVTFKDIMSSPDEIWSLLYLTGHLKVLHVEFAMGRHRATFELANYEIGQLFYNIISSWIGKNHVQDNFEAFIHDLLRGDMDAFKIGLNDILMQVVSHHDVARSPECFYHGLMMGLTAYLHQSPNYKLSSNRESALGRFDYMILSHDPNQLSILFEFKRIDSALISKDTDLESIQTMLKSESDNALRQIHTRQYITEAVAFGAKQILVVGLAFCGKHFEIAFETIDVQQK